MKCFPKFSLLCINAQVIFDDKYGICHAYQIKGAFLMKCDRLDSCPFFNDKMTMEQGIGSIFKKKYCLGNYVLCARYKIQSELGIAFVPDNLYPGMHDIAEQIILKHKIESN